MRRNTLTITQLFLWLLAVIIFGCSSNSDKLTQLYNTHHFDGQVAKKIPLYDSLASYIIKDYRLFRQEIDAHEGYLSFRYRANSYEMDVFNQLPGGVSAGIANNYARIGKDFISGFELFRDSTIKFYIRTETAPGSRITIEHNLSYYPEAIPVKQREFPDKDTVLGKQWQYWMRFNEPGLF